MRRVGDPSAGLSTKHNFTTGPPSGQAAYPMRLGLVGDVGLTYNSTDTIAHLVASRPEMVIFTGGERPSIETCTCAPASPCTPC